MPITVPREPFATPPRLADSGVVDPWDGQLDLDRGYARLRHVRIEGPMDLAGCDELELIGCQLAAVSFDGSPQVEVDLDQCQLETCDLSQLRVSSLRKSTLRGCRLPGTDLSEVNIEDTEFVGGVLRYANLRMATLRRVAFTDTTLDDVDMYGATLDQVSFAGSELHKVVFDKAALSHVDLRGAAQLEIVAATGLAGALITQEQVIELAMVFALASGVDVASSAISDQDS